MSGNIAYGRTVRKKNARKKSATSDFPEFTEICACCGEIGVVGCEIGPLASHDWVHHSCWEAFHFAGRRAVLPGDLF
jgi:hypothetical protein